MKTTKQIKLDWSKLLAFRQYQLQSGSGKPESLDRLKVAMVGGKSGVKIGVKPATVC